MKTFKRELSSKANKFFQKMVVAMRNKNNGSKKAEESSCREYDFLLFHGCGDNFNIEGLLI